jgi:hypothetical protein
MHSICTGHHLTDVIEEWRVCIMSGVLVLLCAAANSAYRAVATSYPVFNCLENRCADWYRVAVEHCSQFCRCVSLAGVITVLTFAAPRSGVTCGEGAATFSSASPTPHWMISNDLSALNALRRIRFRGPATICIFSNLHNFR